MKTRAFKKAISVLCVLAMLLSICVTSLVGTASAAEATYTLNNNGVVTTVNLAEGAEIPAPAAPVDGVEFQGWYSDINFTNKVEVAGAATTLYAKYNATIATFDYTDDALKGVYDPNNQFGVQGSIGGFQIVADPDNADNKVLLGDQKYGGLNTVSTCLENYPGSGKGLTVEAEKTYVVSFKYKATKGEAPYASGIKVAIFRASDAGVGIAGNKSEITNSYFQYTDTWTEGQIIFTAPSASSLATYPNIVIAVGDGNHDRGKMYMDDIVVQRYVPKLVAEDFEMDFEDDGENEFAWSKGNNFTYNSGNGYVTRGEIVEDTEDNKVFKMMHFKKKKGNQYFTVDNGAKQLTLVEGGIYTVEFDYFVQHSETETHVKLYYVNGASGSITSLTVLDEFVYRDDDAAEGWSHASYTFIASADAGSKSSLGIGLYNATNCPEEYASVVLFDNVKVKTYSVSGTDALIVFDSMGGDACESMTVEVGKKAEVLPAPTRYGYNFAGWQYDVTTGEGDEAVTESYSLTTETVIPEGILNAYATWTLKEGVIELGFRTNNEEYDNTVGTIVAYPGQPVENMPEAPTYDNQEFVAWYLDRNLTKPFDASSAPAESTILYAKWASDGIVVDYEDYTITDTGRKSDRYKLITEENGNKCLSHSLEYGTNKSADAIARAMFQDAGKTIRAYEGAAYKITFKYKVEKFKTQGKIFIFLSSSSNTWGNYKQQTGSITYTDNTDGWVEGVIEFDATIAADATSADNYMAFGCNGDATVYFDDVVISCPENDMNIYGSAIRFNVNGGKVESAICGDPGDTIKLPIPRKAGYKFVGWYTDSKLETPFTETTFGEEGILLHAKWQLGKFEEGFEDYPASVQQLGFGGGYSFYTSTAVGYDSSNIRSGKFSIARNGATAGVKQFTLMRSGDLALTVGETYTLTFWVKPTAITVNSGALSLMSMASFTGITAATPIGVITAYSNLNEGEWQKVEYTFTATTPFVALGTTAGCDMYIDDVTITLKGYTGSAPTGDNSVNPMVILAVVILSAGALLITGKKVFSK